MNKLDMHASVEKPSDTFTSAPISVELITKIAELFMILKEWRDDEKKKHEHIGH